MKCPNCNADLEENLNFCPKCGTRLSPNPVPIPPPPAQMQEEEAVPTPPAYAALPPTLEGENGFPPPPKKRTNKLLIAGLALLSLCIVAGAVGGIFYYKHVTHIRQLQAQLAELIDGSQDLSQWVSQENR